MGDFVRFQGSDYMKPKFITDSVAPIGDRIVCFDGHDGPSSYIGRKYIRGGIRTDEIGFRLYTGYPRSLKIAERTPLHKKVPLKFAYMQFL